MVLGEMGVGPIGGEGARIKGGLVLRALGAAAAVEQQLRMALGQAATPASGAVWEQRSLPTTRLLVATVALAAAAAVVPSPTVAAVWEQAAPSSIRAEPCRFKI